MIADNELGLTVHLFLTNPQHILDVGGEVCIPADLLTKKHDLSVEDLSTGSNWQAGLPWMKLGTEDMPLSPYQLLFFFFLFFNTFIFLRYLLKDRLPLY